MKLIVGLGNPGEKYEATRHNLGFMVLEQLLKDCASVGKTVWSDEKRFKSEVAAFDYNAEKIILARPKTYMNNSGMTVSLLSGYYKIQPGDIWIVNDELDLPLGTMKIRLGGAAAGHKGVMSVIDSLGTDKFWRFRLGIGVNHTKEVVGGHTIKNAEEFVLGTFRSGERGKARELIKRASNALQSALGDGMDTAMNRYNTK